MAALPRLATALRRHAQRQWTIFGWMGLPMILIFLLSAAWTAMLAAIQLAPTAVANYLMGTGEFDYGEFWLLSRADDDIAVASAVLLFVFAAGYVWLVMRMVFADALSIPRVAWWWTRSFRNLRQVAVQPASTAAAAGALSTSIKPSLLAVVPADTGASSPRRLWRRASLKTLYNRLFSPTTQVRDSAVMCQHAAYALPKLVLQSTTLIKYLRDGFPSFLILNYATLLSINWFIACDQTLHQRRDPDYVRRRVIFSFDLFFAVLAPLLVLVYAYNHFAFDREVFATRTATLSPGSFDRTARLFADPTQVSLFRIAFQAMQLTTPSSLLIKVVLNVFTLRKWNETIQALERRCAPLASPSACCSDSKDSDGVTASDQRRSRSRRVWATGFASAGVGLLVYTVVAIISSKHICRAFPRCHVPSYRWNVGATCSCIVFVDRETRVRSFAEWRDLPDTTAHLATIALAGDLRVVQVINRQVPELPDELRQCHGLEQLILIHTRTRTFPDWTTAFTGLQYLHIEGDRTAAQLTQLPDTLFADMPHLQFLHLGLHLTLPRLPRFGNLPRLRYLVLALMHGITEIPSLDHLHNLRQLNIIDTIRVTALPSVRSLTNLNTFVLVGRNPVCCNGFLTGVCDLTHRACLDRSASGGPLVACTQARISSDDTARLEATQGIICAGPPVGLTDLTLSYETIDAVCGGVEYRQCTQNGSTGICFPGRMDPISCQFDPSFTAMRRLQIARNVGDVCDPETEAWLGCTRSR